MTVCLLSKITRNPSSLPLVVDGVDQDVLELEQRRRKLLCLFHAATCKHDGDRCTKMIHCQAVKRLYRHLGHCRRRNCEVPGCHKSKQVWAHFCKCDIPTCLLCQVVPLRPSTPTTASSPPPSRDPRHTRPPLSPNRRMLAYDPSEF
jgi:hypothetical protein